MGSDISCAMGTGNVDPGLIHPCLFILGGVPSFSGIHHKIEGPPTPIFVNWLVDSFGGTE